MAKLNPLGTEFLYATYLGGSAGDFVFRDASGVGRGIAVDNAGNAIVFGQTDSNDFPLVSPSQRWPDVDSPPAFTNPTNTFVTKLDASGAMIVYSTYLGSWAGDTNFDIAADSEGNVYLTGTAGTQTFPLDSPLSGEVTCDLHCVFVVKLNPEGCRAFSTLLGGSVPTDGFGIAVDASGDAYIAGVTGEGFPTANAFQPFFQGSGDAYVTKIGGIPSLTGCNPISEISTISPGTAHAGDAGFTLTVTGLDFTADSVVHWAGLNRPTTFVSDIELQAVILAEDIDLPPGTIVPVTVFTSAPGGGESKRAPFLVSSARPTLTDISPASRPVGTGDFTITATGSNFQSDAVLRWNGLNRLTTFGDSTELNAAIPASDIVTEGTAQISILNPDDTGEGSISNELTFAISAAGDNPVPAVTSLSPPNSLVGSPSFSLYVIGSGFVEGSIVRWDGAGRTTNFASDTELSVVVTSTDLAVGGIHQLTVFNPAPGGGESAPKNFNVVNPGPKLTAISPSNLDAGGGDFTLTVDGTDFIGDSVVYWNGSSRTTTYVNGGQLTATIPAADITAGGESQVTINTPAPGGGNSNAAMFTVDEFITEAASGQPTSATVPAGGSANFGFTIAPSGSFDQPVTFSCSGLPEKSSCSFSPTQVTPGADPTDVTVTISTTAEGTAIPISTPQPAPPVLPVGMLAWLALGLFSLTGLTLAAREKQLRPRFAVAALLLFGLIAVGCGTAAQPIAGTPIGIYTITVKATSGTLVKTLDYTLTVN